MQLSIIIVNYNVKYFLEQCLCSVTKALKNIEAEIFVVDNNSSDGSEAFFRDKFGSVKFIWNKTNEGFSKANNKAFKLATGKYILFLNPDTIVPEDCFEKCISFFEAHSEAGGLGVRMINGKGIFLKESKRSFPSPLTALYKLTGLAGTFPRSKKFAKYHLGNLDQHQNHEVDVLAGAFMMIPKKVLEVTGTFDEAFFMYGEDVDLSYRIQKAGFKNYYFAQSTIIHFKGESTKKESFNYVRLFYKAMSIFVNKHYGKNKAGLFNFLIQLAIFFRALVSVTGGFIKRIMLYFKGKMIKKNNGKQDQTIVIGTEKEYEKIQFLMKNSGVKKRLLSRLDININSGKSENNYISQLCQLNKNHKIKEVILCEGEISFKKVIDITEKIPKHIESKIFSYGSENITGGEGNYNR